MATDQNKNYDLIFQRMQQFEAEVEKTDSFVELRNKLINLRNGIKDVDLQANAQKKFIGWATKLLYKINDREKDVTLASLAELERKVEEIKRDIAQKTGMEDLRKTSEHINGYITSGISYLKRNPDKRHAFTLPELEELKRRITDCESARITMQRQRTAHFRQVQEDFESKIAALEIEVQSLAPDTSKDSFDNLSKELRELLAKKDKFHPSKRGTYRDRIVQALDQLFISRSERQNAATLTKSQENKAKYQGILDSVEGALEDERLDGRSLKDLRANIFSESWGPLSSKNDDGKLSIFLIKQHRDELFNAMRILLSQIDDRIQGNRAFADECIKNRDEMDGSLKGLRDKFDEYRDNYYDGIGMNKGDLLRTLNEMQKTIRIQHQQLKNSHYFVKDKLMFRESLNELWTDTKNMIQAVANPEWSMEWLVQKIEMNSRQGNAILQLVDRIPQP